MTQKTVKTFCKAFGFKAKYSPEYREWCIVRDRYPFSHDSSFFTNDTDDVIYTMLAEYRRLRNSGINFVSAYL